jgi:hypothetical protein
MHTDCSKKNENKTKSTTRKERCIIWRQWDLHLIATIYARTLLQNTHTHARTHTHTHTHTQTHTHENKTNAIIRKKGSIIILKDMFWRQRGLDPIAALYARCLFKEERKTDRDIPGKECYISVSVEFDSRPKLSEKQLSKADWSRVEKRISHFFTQPKELNPSWQKKGKKVHTAGSNYTTWSQRVKNACAPGLDRKSTKVGAPWREKGIVSIQSIRDSE